MYYISTSKNPEGENVYRVLYVGLQEATEEICVVYQMEYGERLVWVRNLDDWLTEVEWKGKKIPRFQKVEG